MITHKQWLKEYKNCRSKLYAHGISISQYTQILKPYGHFMCGDWFPFGKRCMYKICPKIEQDKKVAGGMNGY